MLNSLLNLALLITVLNLAPPKWELQDHLNVITPQEHAKMLQILTKGANKLFGG
jgi:hypothetical protein